ncbi:DUF2867 domain-containing protein [Actinomycetota bacterium Odt1-20B]
MRIPSSAHTGRPWRIHEIAADFRVEDVWALPTPGGPDDFERFVRMGERIAGDDYDPTDGWAWPARALWDLRWRLGRLLGWDEPRHDLGARVPSLRDRLPADLRDGPPPPVPHGTPFRPVYLTGNEMCWELSNKTVHCLSHYGWVPDGSGGYHAQMTALVKPNGWLGRAYMAWVRPLRYLIVYPQLMKQIARRWQSTPPGPAAVRPGPAHPRPARPGP